METNCPYFLHFFLGPFICRYFRVCTCVKTMTCYKTKTKKKVFQASSCTRNNGSLWALPYEKKILKHYLEKATLRAKCQPRLP